MCPLNNYSKTGQIGSATSNLAKTSNFQFSQLTKIGFKLIINFVLDYLSIIHKYIDPNSKAYKYYIVHSTLVAHKSLKIARNMGLTQAQLEFIEEASMLHDIGIPQTDMPSIGCYGDEPYLLHMTIGKEMLLKEGLPKHAEVAEKHTTITKSQIINENLPFKPPIDMYPKFLEGEIIAFSDMSFTKNPPELWIEKTPDQIIKECELKYGPDSVNLYKMWLNKFRKFN